MMPQVYSYAQDILCLYLVPWNQNCVNIFVIFIIEVENKYI